MPKKVTYKIFSGGIMEKYNAIVQTFITVDAQEMIDAGNDPNK